MEKTFVAYVKKFLTHDVIQWEWRQAPRESAKEVWIKIALKWRQNWSSALRCLKKAEFCGRVSSDKITVFSAIFLLPFLQASTFIRLLHQLQISSSSSSAWLRRFVFCNTSYVCEVSVRTFVLLQRSSWLDKFRFKQNVNNCCKSVYVSEIISRYLIKLAFRQPCTCFLHTTLWVTETDSCNYQPWKIKNLLLVDGQRKLSASRSIQPGKFSACFLGIFFFCICWKCVAWSVLKCS